MRALLLALVASVACGPRVAMGFLAPAVLSRARPLLLFGRGVRSCGVARASSNGPNGDPDLFAGMGGKEMSMEERIEAMRQEVALLGSDEPEGTEADDEDGGEGGEGAPPGGLALGQGMSADLEWQDDEDGTGDDGLFFVWCIACNSLGNSLPQFNDAISKQIMNLIGG